MEHKWWMVEFWGTEIWRIIALTVAIFCGYFVAKIVGMVLKGLEQAAERRSSQVLVVLTGALRRSLPFIGLALGINFGVLFLDLAPAILGAAATTTSVLLALAIGWMLFCLVDVPTALYRRWSSANDSKLSDMLVPMIRTSLRVTVVVLTVVQVAQLLSDKPVSSLLAGLGIGGLAVALAAQDSLKHLFGSIVIFADRPFEVGDRLTVDGHDGPVEEVGFRSTRIRTLDGHLVSIPNGELVNKSILNISKRPFIRRLCNITITYDTPPEKVEEAIAILKAILDNHEGMNPEFPPRVYFNNFNDASLNLFVIYWYHPPNYWDFMAFGERFNLEVFRRFNEAGIDFAFPTQTLYLAGDAKRPLNFGIHDLDKLPHQPG